MRLKEDNSMPYMKSLAVCLNKMVQEGYTEDFRVTEQRLQSVQKHCSYSPEDIEIVNSFRFEGPSDPDDNAILYAIETSDGSRGILIDSYGVYNDPDVSKFMKAVARVHKKNCKN